MSDTALPAINSLGTAGCAMVGHCLERPVLAVVTVLFISMITQKAKPRMYLQTFCVVQRVSESAMSVPNIALKHLSAQVNLHGNCTVHVM